MDTYRLDETIWVSAFVKSVFRVFASASTSCDTFLRNGGVDDGKTAIEIEARLGDPEMRLRTNRFSPSCEEKLFTKMKGFFCKNALPTETFDLTFSKSRIRVSVRLIDGEPTVVEVMRKQRDTIANVDALLEGRTSRDNLEVRRDARVSCMIERQVSEEEFQVHCDVAKQWIRDFKRGPTMFNSSPDDVRLRELASGSPMRILPSVGQNFEILQSSPEFMEARGWLQQSIQWTILQPASFPVDGQGYPSRTPNPNTRLAPDQRVLVGNLPGRLRLKSGKEVPISLFEYQLYIFPRDVFPASLPQLASLNDNIGMVRFKRRWKSPNFRQGYSGALDFTETRQGETQEELHTAPTKYEVELERSFGVTEGSSLNPTEETVVFLRAFADVFLTVRLPQPTDVQKDSWQNTSLTVIVLDRFDQKRTQDGSSQIERGSRSNGAVVSVKNEEMEPLSKRVRTGDEEPEAEGFYNGLKRNREDRVKSYIFHMRCMNNFVKSCLLSKYIQLAPGGSPRLRILELSCGKGADYYKMKKSARTIQRYVGTDIAKNSLEEAVQRLGKEAESNAITFIQADLTQCDLSRADWGAGKPLDVFSRGAWETTTEVLAESEKFTFVSMQFAFHYMFCSFDALDRFFHGVAARMEPLAYFAVTTVSADSLISALLASPERQQISLKDEKKRLTCVINFEEDACERLLNPQPDENWLGLKYHFRLFDGDDTSDERAVDAPEYLVTMPAVKLMADKHGLEIVERRNLGSFAIDELEKNNKTDMWRRMSVPNREGTISDIEWDIACLYQVLVFRKKATMVADPYFIRALTQLSQEPGWDDLAGEQKTRRTHELANHLRAAEQ